MQIRLKLALDVLGIPVHTKNYRKICDAVYWAKEKKGIELYSGAIIFDEAKGHAYAPCPLFHNHHTITLLGEVCDIEDELRICFEMGINDESKNGWTLGDDVKKGLLELKQELAEQGLICRLI